MASATQKVEKIRARKRVTNGARRKSDLRRELRRKTAEVGELLGLTKPGLLATEKAS
jgi:hypothetical protein